MKRLLTHLLLLTSFLGFTINAGADDRWETLRAINWVENPTNHGRAGRFGELGPYQFRAATWRMHTRKSFQLAKQRASADEVAVAHYEWIKQRLEKAGVDPSIFNIAMAWNSGVENVINGRAPSASYDYAQRVTNLVHSFKQSAAHATAQAATRAARETPVQPAKVVTPVIGMIHFTTMPDAPRFEVLAMTGPAPVVYTDRSLAPASDPTTFVIRTTPAPTRPIILANLGN